MYYILLGYIGEATPQLEARYGSIVNVLMNYTVIYVLMVLIAAITLWTGLVYTFENRKIIHELFKFSKNASEAE